MIDTLVQVYRAHEIPTFVIFDNDEGLRTQDRNSNRVLCRLIDIDETDAPPAALTPHYAILSGNWELQMTADVELIQPGLYDNLEAEVRQTLALRPDSSKPLVARYVAQQLVERDIVPAFVERITRHLKSRLGELQHPIA